MSALGGEPDTPGWWQQADGTACVRAADEVVWSCYRPFFELPALKNWRPPAPLPYIEPTSCANLDKCRVG